GSRTSPAAGPARAAVAGRPRCPALRPPPGPPPPPPESPGTARRRPRTAGSAGATGPGPVGSTAGPARPGATPVGILLRSPVDSTTCSSLPGRRVRPVMDASGLPLGCKYGIASKLLAKNAILGDPAASA